MPAGGRVIGGIAGVLGLGGLIDPENAEAMFAGKRALGWGGSIGKFVALHDRMPRFEIDDSGAKLLRMPKHGEDSMNRLGDVLEHDQLFANYPELRDMNFFYDPDLVSARGEYFPGYGGMLGHITVNSSKQLGKDELLDTILHETQHGIQQREGFSPGASSHDGSDLYGYLTSPGEVEARNTANRRLLSAEERLHTQPYQSQIEPPVKKKTPTVDLNSIDWTEVISKSRKNHLAGKKGEVPAGLLIYTGSEWPTETQRMLDHQQRIRDLYSPERAREMQMRDIAEREALEDTWNPLESIGTGIIGGIRGVIGNLVLDPALEALGL